LPLIDPDVVLAKAMLLSFHPVVSTMSVKPACGHSCGGHFGDTRDFALFGSATVVFHFWDREPDVPCDANRRESIRSLLWDTIIFLLAFDLWVGNSDVCIGDSALRGSFALNNVIVMGFLHGYLFHCPQWLT
jgi:hypothetical protein